MSEFLHYFGNNFTEMDRQYRLNLINSLSGFKSAILVGTSNKNGQTNLAVMSSFVHIGANPPLIGFIMRPPSVRRDTLNNIMELGEYTMNYADTSNYVNSHHTSAKFDEGESEFERCGFEEWYSERIKAPYVKSSKIKVGLKFEEKHIIKANGTILIVGSVDEVIAEKQFMLEDGIVDFQKAEAVSVISLDCYHTSTKLARLSHAHKGEEITKSDF